MLRLLFVILITAGCVCGVPRDCQLGAQYLGAAYELDPLGEGYGYDPDPLIRTDAFDCTTFVETVLANGDVGRLNKIRYADGIVAFERRNHFIETDWLVNNAAMLENVSGQYGRADIRRVLIDKSAWARVVHGIEIQAAPVATDIEYIPYEHLEKINTQDVLIALFIVGNSEKHAKIGTDIAVVHMGFVLPGGKVLRHASTGRGVVDDDFAEYVEMRRKMKGNIGVALVKIK